MTWDLQPTSTMHSGLYRVPPVLLPPLGPLRGLPPCICGPEGQQLHLMKNLIHLPNPDSRAYLCGFYTGAVWEEHLPTGVIWNIRLEMSSRDPATINCKGCLRIAKAYGSVEQYLATLPPPPYSTERPDGQVVKWVKAVWQRWQGRVS